MRFYGHETNDSDHPNNPPGIFIPCKNIEELQKLIYTLFESGVLGDDSAFIIKNVPEEIFDILNTPDYFEETELAGIKMAKGQLNGLTTVLADLL